MSGSRSILIAAVATVVLATPISLSSATEPSARGKHGGYASRYGFGFAPTREELESFFAIPPDGRGLPPGAGTHVQGQAIYSEKCAACHGDRLQGWAGGMMMPPEMAAMGDGRLVGGRGSLNTAMPVLTVESFWPYATTLWDYIKRAMPQQEPGSLSDGEVYALVAFLLGEAGVTPKSAVMDAQSVPGVVMPNRQGFVPDARPELELMRDPSPGRHPKSAGGSIHPQ